MSKLRILYVSFNMPWRGGGTFYRVMGFARELARKGHAVTVLATDATKAMAFAEQEVEGVNLVTAPAILRGKLRTGWDPYEVMRRCLWLRGHQFDLIHGFESRPVVIYPSLLAKKRSRAPLILDWCDWFGRGGSVEERSGLTRAILRPVETYFEEHFRHRADGTTTINSVLRKRAVNLGVSPETILWLPNGAETERIGVRNRLEAREALGLDPAATLIGYLGQAFARDAELMASAFARMRAAHPGSRLVLIGTHKTDIASLLDRPEAVIDTGYVSDEQLNDYLGACDLLWLPLRDSVANRGRLPMKINDYMSSGRAVVSTGIGDLVSLFEPPHPIGVLADDTPEDFARKTLSLLDDENARHVYGRNGRIRAETEFAWPIVTTKLEDFYHQVLGYNR